MRPLYVVFMVGGSAGGGQCPKSPVPDLPGPKQAGRTNSCRPAGLSCSPGEYRPCQHVGGAGRGGSRSGPAREDQTPVALSLLVLKTRV